MKPFLCPGKTDETDGGIEGDAEYLCRKKDMKKVCDDATLRDEDGIILFDASDDGNDEDRDNGDVFSQEYMLEFARKHDAEIARNKRIDRLVSVGVILGIILFTALLAWLNY